MISTNDTLELSIGDEFVILLQGPMVPDYAARVAEKIQERFAVPFVLKGQPLTMTPVSGLHAILSMAPANDNGLNADKAMYLAKNRSRI